MRKIIFITALFCISCNFNVNVKHENEQSEKAAIESIGAVLYQKTIAKQPDSIIGMFSDSFFKTADEKSLRAFLSAKDSKLGNLEDFSLEHMESQRVSGTDSKNEALLVYKTKYSRFDALEKISLVKEGDKWKIFGYHVDSDGFK